MKVLATEFRSLGAINDNYTLGIVLTENSTKEITCRIGLVPDSHEEPTHSAVRIMMFGGKLFQSEALAFFPQHTEIIQKQWKDGEA